MYDPDKKILFVHIAKTGGSSISHYYAQSKFPDAPKNADILHPKFIRKYLMVNQPHPHCGIKEYEKILNLDEYYKFAVIRKPIDYIHSIYYEWPQAYTKKSFKDFILSKEFVEKIPTQVSHLLNSKNEIDINELYKFENLDNVFRFIDIKFQNKNNESLHIQKTFRDINEITEELSNIVNECMEEDFNIYNKL
jgi:hypothetical protein